MAWVFLKSFDPSGLNPWVAPAKNQIFFFELIKKETDVSELPIYRLIYSLLWTLDNCSMNKLES